MALLEVRDLHTYFNTKRGTVKAVNGVSYSVESGKTLGIVGESGSGKSVSAMSIIKLLDGNGYIESGQILFNNRDLTKLSVNEMAKIRGNDISVIFQEPMTSLNPVFTIEKQISEPFIIHQGMGKKEARAKTVEMLSLVKIPYPETVAKQYPHQLSGGMCQRVMIAMALACKPKLLIADEPTTALDVTIQAQILRLIRDLQTELDLAVVFVTHDLGVVAEIADRVAVMYAGRVVETGSAEALFARPAHPYTRALMNSRIGFARVPGTPLESIGGTVPAPTARPAGCAFAPRCTLAQDICSTRPALAPAGSTLAACHLAQQHLWRS